jgi:hypothetical protein
LIVLGEHLFIFKVNAREIPAVRLLARLDDGGDVYRAVASMLSVGLDLEVVVARDPWTVAIVGTNPDGRTSYRRWHVQQPSPWLHEALVHVFVADLLDGVRRTLGRVTAGLHRLDDDQDPEVPVMKTSMCS